MGRRISDPALGSESRSSGVSHPSLTKRVSPTPRASRLNPRDRDLPPCCRVRGYASACLHGHGRAASYWTVGMGAANLAANHSRSSDMSPSVGEEDIQTLRPDRADRLVLVFAMDHVAGNTNQLLSGRVSCGRQHGRRAANHRWRLRGVRPTVRSADRHRRSGVVVHGVRRGRGPEDTPPNRCVETKFVGADSVILVA
jgi:hypothetical protein